MAALVNYAAYAERRSNSGPRLQNLALLLNKIREIVSAQTEAEVLETCGRTLEYLCGEQCAVYSRCNVARATVTDMCVNKYKEAIDDFRNLIEGVSFPTFSFPFPGPGTIATVRL